MREEWMKRGGVFLFAAVTLILMVLIGIEAGTAVEGILDLALIRAKTRLRGFSSWGGR
jgi:hypothetical protein